jgi:predicted phage-related endonuclease
MHQEQIDADRPKWLEIRRQGITASEIAAVMGIAPSSHKVASPFALYVAKVTGVEPVGDATEMLMGHHLEPVAADLLARARPELNV